VSIYFKSKIIIYGRINCCAKSSGFAQFVRLGSIDVLKARKSLKEKVLETEIGFAG